VFCVSVLFCVLFLLLHIAVTYFCTNLLTTATGGKSDSVNRYRITSIRIFCPHILNPGTKRLRSSASRIRIPFFSLRQHRRLHTRMISPVKRSCRLDVKFCPQTEYFRGGQLPDRFARASAHTLRADSHYTSRFRSVLVPSPFRQIYLCSHCRVQSPSGIARYTRPALISINYAASFFF